MKKKGIYKKNRSLRKKKMKKRNL